MENSERLRIHNCCCYLFCSTLNICHFTETDIKYLKLLGLKLKLQLTCFFVFLINESEGRAEVMITITSRCPGLAWHIQIREPALVAGRVTARLHSQAGSYKVRRIQYFCYWNIINKYRETWIG